MNIRRTVRLAVGLATAAIAATSVVMPAGASGGTAESILGSGSDTTQFMMNGLDNLYLFSPGCNQLANPGGTQQLDFSCSPAVTSLAGTSTSGSSTVTMADTTAVVVGQMVTGPGLAVNTFVGTVTTNANITLSSSQTTNTPVNASSGAGSGTFTFSYDKLVTENYKHDQVHQAYFLGSSNGIAQLCEQGLSGVAHIDYARSSRAPKTSDCTGLHFVAYARDGISWEAFNIPGSGINNGGVGMNNTSGVCAGTGGTGKKFCLTQQNLKDIYINCTITNWSQVGGANVPMVLYTPQPGSGTRATWDKFLGGNSATCPGVKQVPENSNANIQAADKTGAIFPFSFGVWSLQVKGAGGAILGAVDAILPSAATIGNGTFPYGRFLYNVYSTISSSAATVAYVGEEGWICKSAANHGINPVTGKNFQADIAATIKQNGFVPIPSGQIGGGDLNSDFCRLFTT